MVQETTMNKISCPGVSVSAYCRESYVSDFHVVVCCMVHFFIEFVRCLWIRRDIQSGSGQGLKYPGNWWSSCRIRDCSTPTLKMNLCPGWKILYHTTDNSSTKSDKKYKQNPRPETSMPRFHLFFWSTYKWDGNSGPMIWNSGLYMAENDLKSSIWSNLQPYFLQIHSISQASLT